MQWLLLQRGGWRLNSGLALYLLPQAAKAAAQQAKAAAQEAPGDAPRDEAHLNAQQGAATAAEPGASRADEVPPAEALPSSGSPGPQELVRPAVLPLFRCL